MDKTGIYLLHFGNYNKVYIGQSVRINRRYLAHLALLRKNTHFNYKLQEDYNLYKLDPSIDILEECSSTELDNLEIQYIEEFNSIDTGYNITNGGSIGRGYTASKSKYTKEELEEIFFLLTNPSLTNRDIAEITQQSVRLVETISYNKRHIWLAETYPEDRAKIDKIIADKSRSAECNDYNARKGIVFTVISPEGITHKFSNIARFADANGLNRSHLNQVILGKEKQHKGWRKEVPHVI